MIDALKPCPFCGSDDAEVLGAEAGHYVICYGCALEGPLHDNRAATIEAWNSRAAPVAPAVPQGWQLVPAEATEAMCKAAVIFANGNAVYRNVAAEALKIEEAIYGEAYAAMLAAVPTAQQEPFK